MPEASSCTEMMWAFIEEAFPICRSLTGDGVRTTLRMVAQHIPLDIHEVPSGTPVLDWTVPREWNIRAAWIKDPQGKIWVDFRDNNLHVLGYSIPVQRKLPLEELRQHLYSLPDQPDLIPYRTSYYDENWGFCLPHRLLESLAEGDYEVFIDSTLEDGSLTYGELLLPGAVEDEVLLSCHICHPSLANDNLSGMAVCLGLAQLLAARTDRRYSYRFLFIPGTIGSITWLARNEEAVHRLRHGLVAANLGDRGTFHYKRSRRGAAVIDRAVARVLADAGGEHTLEDFVPFGYDERQYCSPGFDLPIGSLTRTPWGQYPEYHSSADNLEFICRESIAASLATYLQVIDLLEANRRYRNLQPKGEPQLGRRGLYTSIGGDASGHQRQLALLWVLNLSDGEHDLLDIAERSSIPFVLIRTAALALAEANLLEQLC